MPKRCTTLWTCLMVWGDETCGHSSKSFRIFWVAGESIWAGDDGQEWPGHGSRVGRMLMQMEENIAWCHGAAKTLRCWQERRCLFVNLKELWWAIPVVTVKLSSATTFYKIFGLCHFGVEREDRDVWGKHRVIPVKRPIVDWGPYWVPLVLKRSQ